MNIKLQSKLTIDVKDSVSAPELASPILKLYVDCFEELFEWLSLANLLSLRQTCKRLQRVVDYFIKSNYPAVKIGYGKIEIQRRNELKVFQQFDPVRAKMIKQLEMHSTELTKRDIENLSENNRFKMFLSQIEKLKFGDWSRIEGDFYDSILKWCLNLKYLSIGNVQARKLIGNHNQWLLRQYPSLERIELHDNRKGICDQEVKELEIFFQLNPNIQVLSTNHAVLWINRNCFLEKNIQIDRLDVDICIRYMADGDVVELCNLLNNLHDKGFYKHVHMYCYGIGEQRDMDQIARVHGMEKLHIQAKREELTAPPMPDLKELALFRDIEFRDMETIAKNVMNLERFYINQARPNAILPFLRHVPKLKELIMIDALINGRSCFENGIVDLAKYNKERRKLVGATKVTIYVREELFLATKFAKANTELGLVMLKRLKAVEWENVY